jgi:hypothetical protein
MSASLALRRMIARHLLADATLAALVGSVSINNAAVVKIFDEVPHQSRGIDAPYIELAGTEMVPLPTGCGPIYQIALQINCWSRASGRAEASRMADRVAELLGFDDDMQPSLSGDGYALDDIRIERVVLLDDEDGEHKNGIVQVLAQLRRGV